MGEQTALQKIVADVAKRVNNRQAEKYNLLDHACHEFLEEAGILQSMVCPDDKIETVTIKYDSCLDFINAIRAIHQL